jgi:hypothetical protein
MMIRGREIAGRTIAMAVGVILLVVAVLGFLTYCQNQRSKGAQSRVDRSQSEAQAESGKDAIGTVSRSGEAQAASEGQSRQAEQDIRSAEGSNQAVNPAVRDAGLAALCKRAIYKDDPRCRK